MNKVIRLDNPDYKTIDYSDYVKNEKEILQAKEEILKKIPKENILGLSYTYECINGYSSGICERLKVQEYVVIKIKGLLVEGYALDSYPSTYKESFTGKFEYVEGKEHLACSENNILLFLPLVCVDMKKDFFDNYTSNLKKLGYVLLSYIDSKTEYEIIELFENIKSLLKETNEEVYIAKVSKCKNKKIK